MKKKIKWRDVLRLIHPKPITDEQQKVFNEIINDTLPVAERWETELSAHGNNRETWEKLIENNQVGYMAMLRNLRNIINADPENIEKVYNKLQDREQVLKSKQLPFRFFSAYREVKQLPSVGSKVVDVLENAIEYSVENLPKLKGKTVIAIDTSGSMRSQISSKSTVTCADIAKLIAVLGAKICEDVIVYNFDEEIVKMDYTSRSGILQTIESYPSFGGGTDITLPLRLMLHDNVKADRLIILSDNEINGGYWSRGYEGTCQVYADEYRRKINPELWVHAIDLAGYGTQQFIGKNTNIIAGWSEKVLEFIDMAEKGIDTQVKAIENYE